MTATNGTFWTPCSAAAKSAKILAPVHNRLAVGSVHTPHHESEGNGNGTWQQSLNGLTQLIKSLTNSSGLAIAWTFRRNAAHVRGRKQCGPCPVAMRTFVGHLRGLTLLLGSMATGVTTASDFPYSQDGPCGVLPGAVYTVFADCADARHPQRKLRVTVTLPAHPSETISSQSNRTAPYPVVVFFNGFLVRICAELAIAKGWSDCVATSP